MNFMFSWQEQYPTRLLRSRKILFLPLEQKIHIFSPPCNILYLRIEYSIWWTENMRNQEPKLCENCYLPMEREEEWQCNSLFCNMSGLRWDKNGQVSSFSLPGSNLCMLNAITIYYMASSARGQDEPNRALWLATRARFSLKPYNKSFIDQVCSVKIAGYWPRPFLRVYARLGP